MTPTKDSPRAPSDGSEPTEEKPAERRAPDSIVRRVRLRGTFGTRLVAVSVSVLAADPSIVDMARRRSEIPPEHFRTGEVVA